MLHFLQRLGVGDRELGKGKERMKQGPTYSVFKSHPCSFSSYSDTLIASMSCLAWGLGAGLLTPLTGAPGVNVLDFCPNSAASAAPFSPLNIFFAASRSFNLIRRKSRTLKEEKRRCYLTVRERFIFSCWRCKYLNCGSLWTT